jgi:hypothetical protein
LILTIVSFEFKNFLNLEGVFRNLRIDFDDLATAMAIFSAERGIMGCSDQGTGLFYYEMNNQGTLDFKVICSGNIVKFYFSGVASFFSLQFYEFFD